ncbi:MAG: FprA family A-type flavoprotein [Clostridia bacterium]|nr:FprA family A-type flavoprotein [Clostridia bacterium]
MNKFNDIKYVGVNDYQIDLFEGQYVVPNGMAYNSYAIIDEQIAVMDSVDARFSGEWLANIKTALIGKAPDFLIVQHMEPDHSGSIMAFCKEYPSAKIVSSIKAFAMMKNYFKTDFSERRVVITDGATLNLGKHELLFKEAPMVHWPEVIMTYDLLDKILFSADAFGKFGAKGTDEDWACEARRYYFGIVGKYGLPVQNLFKKLAGLKINAICPLHGEILSDNLSYYLDLYNTWSSYGVESDGVLIAYTSVYGNTKKAALRLQSLLKDKGVNVVIDDLARCDMAEAVEDAFRYGKIVLATTTYNGEIFPFMREFINHLVERNFQNRTVAFIENGSWAPTATKVMKSMLEKCKNLKFATTSVKIMSSPSDENELELANLAKELSE